MAVNALHPNVSGLTLPRNNCLFAVEWICNTKLSIRKGWSSSSQVQTSDRWLLLKCMNLFLKKLQRKTSKTCREVTRVWDHYNTCWWAKTSSSGAGRRHHEQHYGEWQAKHEQPWFPRHGANPRSTGPSRHTKISFLRRKSSTSVMSNPGTQAKLHKMDESAHQVLMNFLLQPVKSFWNLFPCR